MSCILCGSKMALKPDFPSAEVRACISCGWQVMKESWASDIEDADHCYAESRLKNEPAESAFERI